MLSVRLDENIENQLNLLAQDKHISKSKIIKVNEQKTSYELGSELFGQYSSGRDDLSTTYKQKLEDKIDAKNNY